MIRHWLVELKTALQQYLRMLIKASCHTHLDEDLEYLFSILETNEKIYDDGLCMLGYKICLGRIEEYCMHIHKALTHLFEI